MGIPAGFEPLRSRSEHRRGNRQLVALFRRAGARRTTVRLQEGQLPVWYLASHELWLVAHELSNRYRNALGPGEPPRHGLVWPSVQLNLALEPGSARPHARFVRDATGAYWVGHSGTLGGRQTGISRAGFTAALRRGPTPLATREVRVADRVERMIVLGTFARPEALLDAIAQLVHTAHAYRSAIAAGLR